MTVMEFNFDTPYELQIQIAKEKHRLIEETLEDEQCWIIFVRETAMAPDPTFELVVAGDVVWESAFLFHKANGKLKKIAIVGNFDVQAEERKGIWDEIFGYVHGISEPLKDKIETLDPKDMFVNYSVDDVAADGLSHGMYLKLTEILPQREFKSAQHIVETIRSVKTPTEIDLIRKACQITEEINNTITQQLRPGMTEIEIQKLFHQEMNKRGVLEAWQRDACPAVDAGPEKEMGHVGPTELKTRLGQTLHNDFGVKFQGYCSDIQRMWFFGKRKDIPDQLEHAFKTVHGAITEAAKAIRPGMRGVDIDKIARDFVIANGYEEYKHALGHQVGKFAHDGGTILGPMWERYGQTPLGELKKGNVFTLELYVKTKDFGMVSLEEMIVITENGCEFIIPRQDDWICLA